MKTVSEILQDADPLRHEPNPLERERARLRHAIVAAASDVTTPSPRWFRRPVVLVATLASIVIGIVAVGSQIWSPGGTTLQAAAIRFEVRLAEDHASDGLREARIASTDRVVYLHPEVIVTNDDIAQSSVVPGDGASRFSVHVQFNAAGAEKMRRATASHVGRPIVILLDGTPVAVPILRAPIDASALLSGDFTKAQAERIVNGIGMDHR